jgi:hypothetical protein
MLVFPLDVLDDEHPAEGRGDPPDGVASEATDELLDDVIRRLFGDPAEQRQATQAQLTQLVDSRCTPDDMSGRAAGMTWGASVMYFLIPSDAARVFNALDHDQSLPALRTAYRHGGGPAAFAVERFIVECLHRTMPDFRYERDDEPDSDLTAAEVGKGAATGLGGIVGALRPLEPDSLYRMHYALRVRVCAARRRARRQLQLALIAMRSACRAGTDPAAASARLGLHTALTRRERHEFNASAGPPWSLFVAQPHLTRGPDARPSLASPRAGWAARRRTGAH